MRSVVFARRQIFSYKVVLADEKMRIGDEADRWRLFDLRDDSVTFVDDIAKSYRTVSGVELRKAAVASSQTALPGPVSPATIVPGTEQRTIAGYEARPLFIQLGDYCRELWISDQMPVPKGFLALAFASELSEGPYAGVMRKVTPQLLAQQGFVVLDRSSVPAGTRILLIETSLVRVEEGSIPAVWLSIPPGYTNLDAPAAVKESPSRRQRVLSRVRGRSTREAESRSSAKDQKAP